MKTRIVLLLLLCCCLRGVSQNRVGLEVGLAQPVGYGPGLTGSQYRLSSFTKPSIGISYLRKVGSHLFVGGKVDVETYNYNYRYNVFVADFLFSNYTSSDITLVHCNSSYLCLGPQVDLGIGKRQLVHFFIEPAAGLLIHGSQTTDVSESVNGALVSDNYQNTTVYLRNVILKLNIGLTEHIPVSKLWHLTITETLGVLSSSTYLSQSEGTNNNNVVANNFSLKVGVMRKYKNARI